MNKQEWISAKIKKLEYENKKRSHEQNIAIAISMYEHMHQNGGIIPNYNMISNDTDLIINPNQIVNQDYYTNNNFPKPPMETYFESPENLGLSNYQQSPQDYAKSLYGAMLTPEGENLRNTVSQGEFQTEEDKKLQDNYNFDPSGKIQFFNPYGGVDLSSAAGFLGQSIENKDTLGTVASGLKLATGLGRDIFGAIGEQRRSNQVMKDYYNRQRNDLTKTVVAEDGGIMFFEEGGTSMDNTNPPIKKGITKRFSTPLKNTMINITASNLTPEEEKNSLAVQKPIHHIQKVQTSEIKSGSLQPGDYYKVYYTDPNKAKIENQDYEYLSSSGYDSLKRMNNFRIYNNNLKTSPVNNSLSGNFEDGGMLFFEEGGEMTLPKALTGEFMTGMDKKNPLEETNAEVETGEHIQHPTGEIQQVIGKTHEEGGEDVKLEDGAKILSDHLKIGNVLAKQFEKDYDLKLKASDTYATVLDKYNKKIGLTKLIEEEEEYIEKLQKQKEETRDEEALGLNTQFLSEKINEITEKKKPLEAERKEVFESVFKKQEDSKPKEKNGDYFEDGGKMIKEMADRYGVPYERALQIAEQFKFQSGGTKISNKFADPNQYIKQSQVGEGYYGDILTNNSQDVLAEIARTHPELYSQYFEGKNILPKDVVGYQNAVNSKYQTILEDAGNLYGADSPQYKQIEQSIIQEKFLNDQSVRGLDSKFGNYTSTRPNYVLNLLPRDEYEKAKKQGVNTVSELKAKFPDSYKKYVEPKGIKSDAFIGVIDETNPVDIVPNSQAAPLNIKETRDSMGVLLLPDQNPMLPDSLQPHLKINRRFDRVDPALISPEQNIQELNRSKNAVINDINNVPGAQRAAALIGLSANTDESINKVITETNKINSQLTSNADARNATIQATEENAGAQDALSYEQRQYRAKALTDNDVRNYYNTLQQNNVHNYEKVNEVNLLNAMYNDFQFNGTTVEKTSPNITFGQIDKAPLSLEQRKAQIDAEIKASKKKSKKYGGRFKK